MSKLDLDNIYPTNNALLINFLLSSDAEILLIITDWAYKSVPNVQKRVCNMYIYIPTELPFCIPPLVVGYVALLWYKSGIDNKVETPLFAPWILCCTLTNGQCYRRLDAPPKPNIVGHFVRDMMCSPHGGGTTQASPCLRSHVLCVGRDTEDFSSAVLLFLPFFPLPLKISFPPPPKKKISRCLMTFKAANNKRQSKYRDFVFLHPASKNDLRPLEMHPPSSKMALNNL